MLSPPVKMDGVENLGVSSPKLKSPLQNRTGQNVLQPSTKHNIIQSPKLLMSKKCSPKSADPYALIRQIDEAERWVERTSIVTKQDHEDNIQYAGDVIQEILEALPLNNVSKDDSGVLNQSHKMSALKPAEENVMEEVTSENQLTERNEIEANDSGLHSPNNNNSIYSINLDELDDAANPFQTRTQIQNSPCPGPSRGEGDSAPDTLNISDIKEKKSKSLSNVNGQKASVTNPLEEIPKELSSSGGSPTNTKLEIDFTEDSEDEPNNEVISKASGYEIDFDKLDAMSNPFETNKQLYNSPLINVPVTQSKLDSITPSNVDSKTLSGNNQAGESVDSKIEPFQCKNQLLNSPVIQHQLDKHDHQNNSALERPEKSSENSGEVTNQSSQIISPGLEMHIGDDTNASGFTIDLNAIDDSQPDIPFKPSKQIENFLEQKDVHSAEGTYSVPLDNIGEDFNPFQTKKQMCNSPVAVCKPSEPESRSEKKMETTSPDEETDPFMTKTQIQNTPPKSLFTLDIEDPFKSKSNIENSPATEAKIDPLFEVIDAKSDISLNAVCLPPLNSISQEVFEDIENPFLTKSAITNSPVKSPSRHVHFEKEDDPFRTKTNVGNSPAEKVVQKTPKTPSADEDALKCKSEIMNSPITCEKTHKSPVKKSPVSAEAKPQWQNANSISKCYQRSSISPVKKALSDSGKSPKAGSPKNKSPTRNSPSRNSPNRSPSRSSPVPKKDEEITPPPPIRGRRKLSGGSSPTLPSSANISMIDVTESTLHPFDSQLDQTVVSNQHGNEMMAACSLLQQQVLNEEFDDNSFIPASEVFNNPAFNDPAIWDLLEKAGSGSGEDRESALARMSLYIKFDPLVKPPKQATKTSPEFHRLSHAGGFLANRPLMQAIFESDENLLGTPPTSKVTSRISEATDGANPIARPDLMGEVDHIFSCCPSMETTLITERSMVVPAGENGDLVQVLQYSEADIKKIRTELELGYQSEILIKEKHWHNQLLEVKEEEQMKLKEALDEIYGYKKRESEREFTLKEMKLIMADYEKTISEVLAEKEKVSKQFHNAKEEAALAKEKATEDTASVENMFSQLLQRYEKLKDMLSKQRQNEETLKNGFAKQSTKLENVTASYKSLKQQAEEKLRRASEELEKSQKSTKAESARLKALLKKQELQVESLESSLKQKLKENEELTHICDELISKVGM